MTEAAGTSRWLPASRPALMGVLNCTPDSFYDGGRHAAPEVALNHALEMVRHGAAIIDVGGESTRPGAAPVSAEQQIRRTLGVITRLAAETDVLISIDTSSPDVIRAAVRAGAGMINDVRALTLPGALEAAAESAVPVCLMHMQGTPEDMQQQPRYANVVEEVAAFFQARIDACVAAGIARDRLALDPGFGFGKTLQHNLTLLSGLGAFQAFGLPLMIGVSRKSMFDRLLGRATDDRLAATLAAGLVAIQNGADILRVHDVKAHADMVAVWRATQQAGADAAQRRN